MRLNGLNNFFIYPGQKLRVSGSASSNTYSTRSAQSTYYSSPVFNHRNLYDWGQCTWHVFNRRAAIGKVLVLIGGMPITGIMLQLEMGIVLMVTQQ